MKTFAPTNVDELKQALAAVESEDVVIEIDREIACGGQPLATPRSEYAAYLIGVTPDAGLNLEAWWDGAE